MNGIYALHRTLHPRGLRAKVQARTVSLWPLSPRLCKSPLKGGGARWRAPGDVRYADETSPWRYRAIPLQRGNKFSFSCLTARPHEWLLCFCLAISPAFLLGADSQVSTTSGASPEKTVLSLSLKKAVELALAPDGNARLQIARELVRQAQAKSAQARGALLPNLDGTFNASNQTRNLAAVGITFAIPGTPISSPELIGPFSTYDVRATASQSIFDLSAIRRYQSSRAGVKMVHSENQHAENEVMSAVAKAYLASWRQSETLNAARANVRLAESIFKLTEDRKAAGTGTGIELTRAQVQLANEQQRLLQAQNEYQSTRLQLLKVVGMNLGAEVEISEAGAALPGGEDFLSAEQALAKALDSRADYQAQLKREESARLSYGSVKWERLPSVVGFGDYGSIGTTTDHMIPTRTYGISVRLPVFDGGRRDARRSENAALWEQEKIKTRDLRQQVELEVRLVLDRLQTARQQVQVAEAGLKLAENEVAQAQRRYQAGMANSLEVTDAQTRLARARDNQIAARYLIQLARVELGQATGTIPSMVQ